MENRLIYKKSNPETASESFQPLEKGKAEYLKISAEIAGADPNDINSLRGILYEIDTLYVALQKSGNGPEGLQSSYKRGDFFRELFIVARDKFKGGTVFQKFNSEILDSLQLSKAVGNPSYSAVLRLMWLADPEGFLKSLTDKHPGKWDESQIKAAVALVGEVGTFYAFQDIGDATHYVREALQSLYAHYDAGSAKDSSFKSLFEHQKDHFEFAMEFKLDWLNDRGKGKLASISKSLYLLGKNAKNHVEFSNVTDERLGDFKESNDVSDILAEARIPAVGGADKTKELYYARPILFAILATHFYRGVIHNPNPEITKDERKSAYEKSVEVFKTYPELRYQYSADFQRAESAEEVAEDVSVEGAVLPESHLPVLKIDSSKKSQTAFGNLMTAEGKFADASNAVIIALQQNEEVGEKLCDDLANGCSELQARLEELFGMKQIIELNPDLKQKVDESASYYDLFALSLQNAAYLPEARKELDKLDQLPNSEWAENFGNLGHVYRTLRDSPHLPPEYVAEYQDLLDRAEYLHTNWAVVLKRSPELDKESPYTASLYHTDDIYEEDMEYTYSPMIDISTEGVTETAEIPEKMSVQLNRLRIIEGLAISLLAVNQATEEDAGYLEPIFGAIEDIEQDLIAYYTSEEYDGKTAFDLEKAIDGSEVFETFLVGVTMLFEEPKATLQGEEPSEFEEHIGKKHGLHRVKNVAVANLRKSPFYNDLVLLLKGGNNLTMANIKRAGAFVAVFQRQYLDDYASSRALMTKLLQPHMVKSRGNIPETVKRSCYSKARHCAVMQVADYLNNGGREQIRVSVTEALLKNSKGRNPTDDEINSAYYEFVDRTRRAQTDVIYEAYLNEAAMHSGIFEFFGKPDAADKAIVKEFRASLGIAEAGMFVIDDKTKEIFEKIATFSANFVVEIVLVGLSVLAAGLVGGFVSRLVSRSRAAIFLLGAKRFETLARLAYLGMSFTTRVAAEAATFLEVYSTFKDEKTLLGELTSLEGVRRASERLLGEMAIFGAFHIVGFLGKMLKQGEIGRNFMRLAINKPEYAQAINRVFESVNRASSGEEALKLLEGIRGLPAEVDAQVRLATKNVDLLRARYFRIISDLPQDTQLAKVCGFLLQDLQFDVLAMILGTAVKNKIVPENLVEEIDLTTRETWFQMYTMAAGFRLGFTAAGYAKRGAGSVWDRAKTLSDAFDAYVSSPLERLARVKKRMEEIEKTELLQYAKDSKRTYELRRELAQLKAEEKKVLTEMRQPVEEALADRVVPSYIARALPKKLRIYLHRHYVDKQGEFVGSYGLGRMLAGNDAEFGEALHMIETARRSLLSSSQILIVASELPTERCKLFLEKIHRLLTPRERSTMKYLADHMTNESFVPDWFTAESPKGVEAPDAVDIVRLRTVSWAKVLVSWLINGAVIITAINEGVAKTVEPRIAPPESRPAATCPMRPEDFRAEGNGVFVIRESEYEGLPDAKSSSNVVLFRGGVSDRTPESAEPLRPKEWNGKRVEGLFSKDASADQKAVFDNLKRAGADKEKVSDMESAFDTLPDSMKPYVRIIATVEGADITPYFVIDKDGLQALVYKEFGELRGELQEIANELKKELQGLEGDLRLEAEGKLLGLENFIAMIGWSEGHREYLQAGVMDGIEGYLVEIIIAIILFKKPALALKLFKNILSPEKFLATLFEISKNSIDVAVLFYIIGGIGWFHDNIWDWVLLKPINTLDRALPLPHNVPIIGEPWAVFSIAMLCFHKGTRERYLGYLRAIRDKIRGKRGDGGAVTGGGGETTPEIPSRSLKKEELPPLSGVLAEEAGIVTRFNSHHGELSADHQRLLPDAGNRIGVFYNAIADLFTNHLRFPDTDAGRIEAVAAFKDIIRARYLSMLMDALIKIRRDPGTYSDGLLRDLEGGLSSCLDALAGLRRRLNNAPDSITHIPDARAAKRAIDVQIEAEMQSQGYDDPAIKDAKNAVKLLLDLISDHPNLDGDIARYRYIEILLGFLAPRYYKALDILETNPNPTESPQREMVADAQNIVGHYGGLQAELGGMGGIDKARVRLDGMNPITRRIIIGAIVAALAGGGYATYRALTKSKRDEEEAGRKAEKAAEDTKEKDLDRIKNSGNDGLRDGGYNPWESEDGIYHKSQFAPPGKSVPATPAEQPKPLPKSSKK